MADLSDVEVALVTVALNALYPAGLDRPSCVGSPMRIFRGEPVAATLERDLAAEVGNVSVCSVPNSTRNTTRWLPSAQTTSGTPTLVVETVGLSVTYAGIAGAGQVAGILVDNLAFVYRGHVNDTPAVVAAVLAEAIVKIRPCLLAGSSLTIPGAYQVVGRVVSDGNSSSEWCRQEQDFCIACWCPTPLLRDRASAVLQSTLCGMSFLSLCDDTSGRLRYKSTSSFDTYQAYQLHRRNLVLDVEYGTTTTTENPTMLFGDLTWSGTTVYV